MKPSRLAIAAALMSVSSLLSAGVYTDDMTKCIVESSGKDDRIALVRWMFAAMAQHPAVASMSTVDTEDVEKANADVGALFMKLLTEACIEETKMAIKYEGLAAIQASFQMLGQVATVDLFSDPGVMKVMAGLEKYTDQEKIAALAK